MAAKKSDTGRKTAGTKSKTKTGGTRSAGTSAEKGKKSSSGRKPAAKTASKSRTAASAPKTRTTRETANRHQAQEPEYIDYALYLEILLWGVIAFAVLMLISFLGAGGALGRALSTGMFGSFGILAWLLPFLVFFMTAFFISNASNRIARIKGISGIFLYLILCAFMQLLLAGYNHSYGLGDYFQSGSQFHTGGGAIGGAMVMVLAPIVGTVGTYLILLILIIICVILITQRSFFAGMRKGGRHMLSTAKDQRSRRQAWQKEQRLARETARAHRLAMDAERDDDLMDPAPAKPAEVSFSVLPKEPRKARKVTGVTMQTQLDVPAMGRRTRPDPVTVAELPQSFAQQEQPVFTPSPRVTEPRLTEPKLRTPEPIRMPMIHAPELSPAEPEMATLQTAAPKTAAAPEPVRPAANRFADLPISGMGIASEPEEETFEIQTPTEEPNAMQTIRGSMQAAPARTLEPATVSANDEYESEAADDIDDAAPAQPTAPAGKPAAADSGESGEHHHSAKKPRSSQEEIEQGINEVEEEIAKIEERPKPEYVFPPLDLLGRPDHSKSGTSEEALRETAAKLQQVFDTFGVKVRITNVVCGPSVTRYELTPELGVKVSKILSLQDDIKLNLAAADIRIEAPIPGKAAIGIEVPNKTPTGVSIRELLESKEFLEHPSNIAYAVGKDIGGRIIVSDIQKMPHLMIAGSTGSGKSVFINTLIMSILYKAKPEDVKLIMIDPKVVELSVYNGIPHLYIPVVTDPKKASGALNWAVAEMTNRYKKFADCHVRDIKGYNKRVEQLTDLPEGERPEKMPQIVIIVDELADLMMVASGEVEDAICRLAQLARAAGIHLVIATQRPSVDVITGLIKANMPSRIAFSVSSGTDSRTILDMNGAEKLLGNGDMLFAPQTYKQPVRVQGAFVSDNEVADVVGFLKEHNSDEHESAAMEARIESVAKTATLSSGSTSDTDDLFADAGRFLIQKDKASIGMLQRWFKIGFNRAARIMDQLSDAGVVGPEEGTKPRKILMSEEQFENYLEQN